MNDIITVELVDDKWYTKRLLRTPELLSLLNLVMDIRRNYIIANYTSGHRESLQHDIILFLRNEMGAEGISVYAEISKDFENFGSNIVIRFLFSLDVGEYKRMYMLALKIPKGAHRGSYNLQQT